MRKNNQRDRTTKSGQRQDTWRKIKLRVLGKIRYYQRNKWKKKKEKKTSEEQENF